MKNKIRLILILAISVMVLGLVFAGCGAQTPETPEATEPVVPETTIDPTAIASVTTGENTVWIHEAAELIDAIDESGNSVVTFYQDISYNKALEVPYSCTIDFGGFTLTTNLQQGLGIQIREAGAENQTTTLKNGQIVSYSDSVRVKAGALVVSNMQITTTFGNCVALYDTSGAYKEINRIENSTLHSLEGPCMAYNDPGADYSATGITLNNVDMISPKADGSLILSCAINETASAVTVLEENVNLYGYGLTACPNGMVFDGILATKEYGAAVTVGDQTYSDMTLWTTDSQQERMDILLIGNSACHSYVDELYGIADAHGIQITVTNLYRAGCSIQTHWGYIEDPASAVGKCEYYVTGCLGRYLHPTITTTVEALDFNDWDVINCQQSLNKKRTKDVAAGLEATSEYAASMISFLKEQQPDARIVWQENWGYGVGYIHPNNEDDDPTNDDPFLDVRDAETRDYMQDIIQQICTIICQENQVDMVPCGDAWVLARKTLGDIMYRRSDMAHDGDAGGGQYLNACVWFETLTGESCIGNTWRPTAYILTEDKIPVLQQAAHDAVAALYG